jgi:hypothetical protein
MNLVHLWPIYLGAAALTLPVLVHWLTRPRPVKLPFSTLRFVRESIEQRRARQRLRDFLVLALRTAAVALLAFAIARPLIGDRASTATGGAGDVARVVIVDVSQSMAAGSSGIEAFERARSKAAEYLEYQPGLRANLIFAGASAQPVFDGLSTNLQALRDDLQRARVVPQRLSVQAALNLASELLATAPAVEGSRREVVIVSDMQRTNWAGPDFSVLPADTIVQVESMAPREPLANLAIRRSGVVGAASQGKAARVEIEVANFSPAARPVACEVALGEAAYRLEGNCPAQSTVTLSQEVTIAAEGWQAGHARLLDIDDALAADNQRAFVVEVKPPATYALVTRQSPTALNSSFFLERALAPLAKREHAEAARVVRIEPAQLDEQSLAGAQPIVLDHPGKLSPEATRLLARLAQRGRAIWYCASEPIDAVNLKQIAEAAGAALTMPVEFLPPETNRARKGLFLASFAKEQAPFHVLGDGVQQSLGTLRFGGGLGSRKLDGGLHDDLVASFSDGSAALVVSSCGAGTIAVLNADLDKSNLPSSPLFVPLVGELVDRLLGQRRRGAAIASGEPLAVYLPPEAGAATGLSIVATGADAAAATNPGELIDDGLGTLWRAHDAPAPGVYRAERGGRTVFALATELPDEESDLRPLEAGVLTERLAGGRRIEFRALEAGQRDEDTWWTWLAVGVVGCILAEWGVLRLFRS